MRCATCEDTGWVCESHPNTPMGDDYCGAPGQPCKCNPLSQIK